MIRSGRALSRGIIVVLLAMALVVPVPGVPAGAIPHEDTSPISVSFAASEQGGALLSGRALACHMHFEHHQLVRSETAFLLTAPEALGAWYSPRVNPLASVAPNPPEKPPRA